MTEDQVARHFCGQCAGSAPGGAYYGALFRFKQEGAAALGLLWTHEGDEWRLVSYCVFEM
jgi:hypothetical protein